MNDVYQQAPLSDSRMARTVSGRWRCCWPSLLLLALGDASFGTGNATPFDVRAHYEKAEYRVPMRDGVHLLTAVYSPRDKSRDYPILMQRTPYWAGPYGPEEYRSALDLAPSEEFLHEGYIFVVQEWRGTYRSEGEFVDFRPLRRAGAPQTAIDESTDTYDTIEWLLENVQGHSGRVGQWGISHPGWATVMGMVDAHPALKASSPQATTANPFIGDDYHHNGAFVLVNLDFLDWMTRITGPGREELTAPPSESLDWDKLWLYDFYLHAGPTDQLDRKYYGGRLMRAWKDIIEHPDYDEYWQRRDFLRPLDRVRVPVLNVAGWFDQPDPYGTVATYNTMERENPDNRSILVVGPWRHGGWHRDQGDRVGDIEFGAKTSRFYQRSIVFPFFQYHLKNEGSGYAQEVAAFETGRNQWHAFDEWPPPATRPEELYLRANGRLAFTPPMSPQPGSHDEYLSVPERPVPYAPIGSEGHYAIADQRYAYTRPDVLSYSSDVLEHDVTIAGPVEVELYASTSGTDADWFVKLIDVYPGDAADNGEGVEMRHYQMLVAYEVMRGKYRDSFANPEPMTPGEVTPIRFQLRDRFHTFRQGHRIMVQIHSSWFPLFDRNPQQFMNIYRAEADDYRSATHRIYRSSEHRSHLVLPVFRND